MLLMKTFCPPSVRLCHTTVSSELDRSSGSQNTVLPSSLALRSFLVDLNLVDRWHIHNDKAKAYTFHSGRHGTIQFYFHCSFTLHLTLNLFIYLFIFLFICVSVFFISLNFIVQSSSSSDSKTFSLLIVYPFCFFSSLCISISTPFSVYPFFLA